MTPLDRLMLRRETLLALHPQDHPAVSVLDLVIHDVRAATTEPATPATVARLEAAIERTDLAAALARAERAEAEATRLQARLSEAITRITTLERPTPAPPPAEAPAQKPEPGQWSRVRKWTPDRIALARKLYPNQSIPLAEVLAQINTLPGEPITSIASMQEGIANYCQPLPARRAGGRITWTPERVALLRRDYPNKDIPLGTLQTALNSLPGPRIANHTAIRSGYRDQVPDGPPRPRIAPPRAAPTPRLAPALEALTPDELQEARERIHRKDGGARDYADWFGWPLDKAQAVAAAIRAELDAAAQQQDAAA
jgi:hypothetical protein